MSLLRYTRPYLSPTLENKQKKGLPLGSQPNSKPTAKDYANNLAPILRKEIFKVK